MKKEYKQPKIRIVSVKTTQMLCSSPETCTFNTIYEDEKTDEYGIDVD